MFVFGAQLFGRSAQERTAGGSFDDRLEREHDEQQQEEAEENEIARLQAEEDRLLSQLAQTRAQLANHESVVSPGPAGRRIYSYPETSSISPPMAYPERLPTPNKRSMQSFSRTAPTSNRKRQRTRKTASDRLLPILSSTGDPVFEVGLHSGDGSEHMLPVFRLPQVGSGSQFLNRMPREALGDEEAQRMHEDEEDEALAASQLGLTEEELAEFDEEVAEKTNRRSSLARRGSATSIGAPDAAMADLDAGNSLPTLSKPSLADASFRSTFSVDKFGGRSTPRCLQPRNDATSDDLRRELGTSISLIQTLTEQVREDIAEVHRTCPVHNIKASMYMQRWGLEKFEQIFKRIELMREGAALRKWRHAVDEIIKFEKKEKYFKLRAAKKCDRFVHRMQNRELHWAFSIWEEGIREMKRRERRALEEESAVMIQCCARCYIARTRVAAIKAQIQSDRENAAASKIQMIYRGRTTRRHVALLLEQITMNRAALMVQRAWRGRAAREAYNKMREAQAMNKAVLMVQCAWRNRHARALMRTIRADRKRVMLRQCCKNISGEG